MYVKQFKEALCDIPDDWVVSITNDDQLWIGISYWDEVIEDFVNQTKIIPIFDK